MAMRVGLLFGGRSGEHEVSIRSAGSIAKALSTGNNLDKYETVPVYIGKDGGWLSGKAAQQVLETGVPLAGDGDSAGEDNLPDAAKLTERLPNLSDIGAIDIWFPILHGPNGEDGTIQGLFEVLQMPYVGCGVLGSALGMDKLAMKSAFAQVGLFSCGYL